MPLDDPDDANWARDRLETFAYAVDQLDDLLRHSYRKGTEATARQYRGQALELEMTVREILAALSITAPNSSEFATASACATWHKAALRGKGLLKDFTELPERIGPGGPRLSAHSLHAVVWSASERLLTDGHHTQAVQTAATAVSVHIAGLTGMELAETALVRQVFSADPPKSGAARLRWSQPGANQRTVQSMNDGIRSFAQGCFLAMRNPAAHGAVDLTEQQAVEQLAALSTLMRWVDQCVIERAE